MAFSMAGCMEDLYAFSGELTSALLNTDYGQSLNNGSAVRHPTFEETKAQYERNQPTPSASSYVPSSSYVSSSSTRTSGSSRSREGNEPVAPYVNKPSTIAVTWETDSGKWGAAGPTQFGWLPEDTEKIALEFVYDEQRYSIGFVEKIGKFRVYRVNQPWSSDNKDIRRWLKEKHGVNAYGIP